MACFNCVVAVEDSNITKNSFYIEFSDESNLNLANDKLCIDENNSILSEQQTITVDDIGENHNEMNQHTIKKAIDSANEGDTIVINGQSYDHVHIMIDKPLKIVSNVGTILNPCSSTAYSGHSGIFYLTEKASGTVIQGFNFKNENGNIFTEEDYGILIRGASNVVIKNCSISNDGCGDGIRIEDATNTFITNVTVSDAVNAIKIKDSHGVVINESTFENSKYGVNLVDSTKTTLSANNISDNEISGVAVGENNQYTTIISNNITNNKAGINLTSSEYVYVLSNYIAYCTSGVYVNCNVTKIEIKGNFFNQNKGYEVLNDHRVKNLIDPKNSRIGYPDLEIIDNNYMIGLIGAEEERPVFRIVYNYVGGNRGAYSYDSTNDVYNYVGEGKGAYVQAKSAVFMRYVFEINKNVNCPVIYFDYNSGTSWSLSGNYELQLSEITQVKKGVYSISIVDEHGNVAHDLSSVPVTFYLNKNGSSSTPQSDDIYKVVMMKNGTATVRFYMEDFASSGNVITAVLPTPGTLIDNKVSKTFNVDDSNIPGNIVNTSLTVTGLNTYPNSNQYVTATLTDEFGNPISGETLIFSIDSKAHEVVTDSNGQVNFKVALSKEGSYDLKVTYTGDEIDYYSSKASSMVIVKKVATKIVSSNVYMIPKMAEYYSVTLKDVSGNVLANQKVTFKVNGKTYSKFTNSKGVAAIKLKFNINKKIYKINIVFAGNNKYKAVSKTNNIVVKYSSKVAKLLTPTVIIPPKTAKYYTITLKDAINKGIIKQKVIVNINGKKYTMNTNSKGQINIKVKFSTLKNYKVSAIYKGNLVYKKYSSSGWIKVAKITTKISAPTVSVLPKQTKSYVVTLKANNKALSKQKLTININGITYTRTTNANGQASINVNFAGEKNYPVYVTYKGTAIYKISSARGYVKVAKLTTALDSNDKTYSFDMNKEFEVILKDSSNNVVQNQNVIFRYDGQNVSKLTDSNGKVSINLNLTIPGDYEMVTSYTGNDKYKSVYATNKIIISNSSNIVFVDEGLKNSEIQSILDKAANGTNVKFLGDYYWNISLDINNVLNIYSSDLTILNANANSPVFRVLSHDVNISGFSIKGNSGDAIIVEGVNNVKIEDNLISNTLDQSKIESYVEGTVNMPGYGIKIINSTNVLLSNNCVSLFESGIYAEDSSFLLIDNNTIRENNYGIKYGFGVVNTKIINNEILEQTGLYIMTVPEGPTGYGIFLNNSAVNVTINRNHIHSNHLGISLDANYSTGIVITQNTITDNVLEGIRFNAGYDLAQNAVEPYVTDNAIYRNARGPSMMILGELSANPEGIYGNGLYVDADKLQLDPNWYGTNQIVTWDYDTGVVGYGTMCPRINTSEIKFNNLTYNSMGNYSVVFYKNGILASNLPKFDLFATLNRGTDKQVEVIFDVVDGIGTFSFDSAGFNSSNNIIEISVGSLIYSTSRVFQVTYSYDVPQNEISI